MRHHILLGCGGGASTLLVDEGGKIIATGTNDGVRAGISVGVLAGSSGAVTNRGTIAVDRLDLGHYDDDTILPGTGATAAQFDNFGDLEIGSRFRMGVKGAPSVFYNHEGATFRKIGGSTYSFYLSVGAKSTFISDGDVTCNSDNQVWMGLSGYSATFILNKSAVFKPGGELRVGYSSGSWAYLYLNDQSRIEGSPAVNIGFGTPSHGYVTLSNESSIVTSGNLKTGLGGASGELVLNDTSTVTVAGMYVGSGSSGTGKVALHDASRLTVNSGLDIGCAASSPATASHGYVTLSNESSIVTSGKLVLGYQYGHGELSMNDNSTIMANGGAWVGWSTFGTGILALNGSSRFTARGFMKLADGTSSTGTVTLAGNSALVIENGVLQLCTAQNTVSSLTVGNGAMLVSTNIYVGMNANVHASLVVDEGGMVSNATIVCGLYSDTQRGELVMRGGKVLFNVSANPDRAPLCLGRGGNFTSGVLHGWGTLAFINPRAEVTEIDYTPGTAGTKPGGTVLYGQAIADGEGQMRDLDMGRTGFFSYTSTEPNTCGTNGWYAVNKGRLKMPRCQMSRNSNYRCIGDNWTLSNPRLVNSFEYVMSGAETNNFMFSELYATDRDDIPADLPIFDGDRTMAVWRIGYFSDGPEADEPINPEEFATAALKFRYPTGASTNGLLRVRVLRHDGTENGVWHQVGSAKPSASSPYVSTGAFPASEANWNFGWFAIVGSTKYRGTLMIVR